MTTPLNPSTASTGIFLGFWLFYVFMLDKIRYVCYNWSIGCVYYAQNSKKRCRTLRNKEKDRKHGVASDKVIKLRTPDPTEVGAMMAWLVWTVYYTVFPRELIGSHLRDACSEELKKLLRKTYEGYRIVNADKVRFIPHKAKRLDYSLYITKDNVGIELEAFLAYAKGGNFVRQSDALAIATRAGIEPDQIAETCNLVAEYFRNKLCRKHQAQDCEPEIAITRCDAPTYNYHVEASSGATVNINNR